MTVKRARELLKSDGKDLSDSQIEKIIKFLTFLAENYLTKYEKQSYNLNDGLHINRQKQKTRKN